MPGNAHLFQGIFGYMRAIIMHSGVKCITKSNTVELSTYHINDKIMLLQLFTWS
jgi:hypothetical protein